LGRRCDRVAVPPFRTISGYGIRCLPGGLTGVEDDAANLNLAAPVPAVCDHEGVLGHSRSPGESRRCESRARSAAALRP
jgi:hypothetical protein